MNTLSISFIFSFLMLIHTFSALAQDKIQKLEPPFWWTGMKNPALQLLVYGENISEWQPHIDDTGISVERVIKVKNPNYLFIDLKIAPDVQPGSFEMSFKNQGETVARYPYQLFAREEGSAGRQGFNNTDVMYLITPDRFANGNPDNDQVASLKEKADRGNPDGRHGGDIQGMINHLDYIADLGFTAIWVNPVLENDQPAYSYHGYSTTDFYQVDARFGTNAEYKKLGTMAQEKGIKFIMDMIVNHCGSEHWWIKDLPAADWLNYPENIVITNHRKSAIQDPYVSKLDHKQFVDGWFVPTMPDLNQRNPLLAEYLIQNSIWWIEYAGLSGIRMDTYPYPDMDFMTDWTCRIMKEYPDFNIVGEEWNENPAIVAYWQRGKANPNGYTSCLPGLMDFPLQAAMRRALAASDNSAHSLMLLYETLAYDFLYADPENLIIFPDNHDMDRFYTQVGEDFDLFKLGLAYVLTMRGIPQIYYGTEVLMTNAEPGNHGLIRTDFPGGWANDPVNAFTEKGLTAEQKEAKAYLKNLLHWRKQSGVIHTGKLMHYAPEQGIYVYFRYDDQKKVMVVLNKNGEDRAVPLERFYEMLEGTSKGKDIIRNQVIELSETLIVPAKSPMIIAIDPANQIMQSVTEN